MADKIVKLVDKNSNNLYPVAGAVIDNAVSTGAISSQAVTNAKIENGAVTGVANNATAIGTAKLALDTVGTPNLRNDSVTSDKIDWTTITYGCARYAQNQTISANVVATVLFPNDVVTDTAGITYNNGVFTVHKAGWWMINAETGGSEGPNWHTTIIRINGAEYTSGRTANTHAYSNVNYCSVSCCAKLNANDTFEIQAQSTGSITINNRAKGNMSACLISPTN